MNKSTVLLLMLAALGLGSLIGVSFVDKTDEPENDNISPSRNAEQANGAPPFRYLEPGDLPVAVNEFGEIAPSASGENYIGRDKSWRTETLIVELPLDGSVEYKAVMEQGDTIVFEWSSAGGEIYTDLHGHDKTFGDDFFVRYEEREGTSQSGAIVAPFSGEHGWYWLNISDAPTEIRLRVAGFFEDIVRIEVEDYNGNNEVNE